MTAAERLPRRGETWLAEPPNQPTDPHAPRPGLVASPNVRNRLAGDVLVVPLSSALRPLPTHVLLTAGEGGQRLDSMATCEQIIGLDKGFLVGGPLGPPLGESRMDEVVRAIRRAVGEIVP